MAETKEQTIKEKVMIDKENEFHNLLLAMQQRANSLRELSNKTTNPLDRLCLNERIDECTQIAKEINRILSL